MGDNKQNRFEEAFERGQQGQISSYNAWLQNQGINPDRLDDAYLTEHLQQHPEKAPNHDNQLEELAEHIGFFTQQGGIHHLSVVAPTGFGKTQLLHTVVQMLERQGVDLPYRHHSATEFIEQGEHELGIHEILDELEELDTAILILDDCEQDKRIDHSLEKIRGCLDDLLIITAWPPEHWRVEQDRINDVLPLSQEITLNTLTETNTTDALRIAVEIYSSEDVEFGPELYSAIYASSFGIPLLFHELLRETFRQSFLGDLDEVDVEAVQGAVEKLHLDSIRDRVYSLSEKKILVLKHVLLSRHPKGQRPSELVERLSRDKSTVSYHLQSLADDRILEKEKQGRSVFYRVRELVKPVLQQRIEKEGEFRA